MATSVLTPVCVTGPSEKSGAIADTSAPEPTEEGFVLASDVPEAAPAGCNCSVSRSSNSAVPDLNPSVSELAMSLPMVSRSVCMVAMPDAAAPRDRTLMGCSFCLVFGGNSGQGGLVRARRESTRGVARTDLFDVGKGHGVVAHVEQRPRGAVGHAGHDARDGVAGFVVGRHGLADEPCGLTHL